jgi:uncharacterized protein
MPRPIIKRKIFRKFNTTYFKPAGIPMIELEEVVLTNEETEAIRLKDVEGLGQSECAEKMGISQPTFFRVIKKAREKIAEALINGKAIRIEGGSFEFYGRGFGKMKRFRGEKNE